MTAYTTGSASPPPCGYTHALVVQHPLSPEQSRARLHDISRFCIDDKLTYVV